MTIFAKILLEIQKPEFERKRSEFAKELMDRLDALQRERLGESYEETPLGPLFRYNLPTEGNKTPRHDLLDWEKAPELAQIDAPYIFLAGNHWGNKPTRYTVDDCETSLGKFVSFCTKRLRVLGVDITGDQCLMYTYSTQEWEGEKRRAEVALLMDKPKEYYSPEAMKFAEAMILPRVEAATEQGKNDPYLKRDRASDTLNIRVVTMSYGDIFLAQVFNATKARMEERGYSTSDIEFMRQMPRAIHFIGIAPPDAKEGTRHLTLVHEADPSTAINGIDPKKTPASWAWLNSLSDWSPEKNTPHPTYHDSNLVCGSGANPWPEYMPRHIVSAAKMAVRADDHCMGAALLPEQLSVAAMENPRIVALRLNQSQLFSNVSHSTARR